MKRLIDALLLRDVWKLKPIHLVPLLLFLAYQGWMASPYFMYYVVGAPEPGTAPRYVGKLRVEGELRRTSGGWVPPRYFLETNRGNVEFHCGYRPYIKECLHSHSFQGLHPVEVGMDPYWGVDYMKFPPPYAHFNENFEPQWVSYGRKLALHGYDESWDPILKRDMKRSKHFWAVFWLGCLVSVYVLLVFYGLLPAGQPVAPPATEPAAKQDGH